MLASRSVRRTDAAKMGENVRLKAHNPATTVPALGALSCGVRGINDNLTTTTTTAGNRGHPAGTFHAGRFSVSRATATPGRRTVVIR